MRVVIAPDSLKGTCAAEAAARAIAEGWLSARPRDDIFLVPLADGGEGTLDVLGGGAGPERRSAEVTGPDGRPVTAHWLLFPSGEAVIELAQAAGLPLMQTLDALGATTRGVGELIGAALGAGARSVTVALGGSATTDGGTGALSALGLGLFDDAGLPLPDGGGSLGRLSWVDDVDMVDPPTGGVRLLTDVTSPLLGPGGAAAVFGPQKGATPDQVLLLEEGLARLARILGGDPGVPGVGAAGGAAYGLAAVWGGVVVPGATEIAARCGLPPAVEAADVVVTAEGRFDESSRAGKVVGHVLSAAGQKTIVIAGSFAARCPVRSVSLKAMAGSSGAARADAVHWLRVAGRHAAFAWGSART